jgi:predicted Rossmann-fold nucleotide-binding protein
VAVNTQGFYDRLAAFFERFYEQKFAKPAFRATCPFVASPAEAMAYIRGYTPPAPTSKWFT